MYKLVIITYLSAAAGFVGTPPPKQITMGEFLTLEACKAAELGAVDARDVAGRNAQIRKLFSCVRALRVSFAQSSPLTEWDGE